MARGRLQLVKNVDARYRVLAEADFPWTCGEAYTLTLRCAGNRLTVLDAAGKTLIDYRDEDAPYLSGAVGVGLEQGRCAFERLEVRA